MNPAPEYALRLLDSIPAMVWTSSRDARCNFFNRSWLEFTGRSLEEELGDGWTAGIHRGDLNDSLKSYLIAFRAREPFRIEYRLRRHDGSYRWVSVNGRPIFDEDDNFNGYLGFCFDITESKIEMESLQADERGLESLIVHAPFVIIQTDSDGKCQFVSDQWKDLTGLEVETAVDNGWFDAVVPDDQDHLEEELLKSFRERRSLQTEFRIINPDHIAVPVLFQAQPEYDEEGALRGCIGTITPFLQVIQTDAELTEPDEETAHQELAARMAHEFNNLLTPIVLNLNMAKKQLEEPDSRDSLCERLEEAEKAGLRLANLTHQLHSLGDQGKPLKKLVSLKPTLEQIVDCLNQNEEIKFHTDIAEDLWPAFVDSRQIRQIILSLLANAFEAMPDGGTLHFSASNFDRTSDPEFSELADRSVCISIKDDGSGIDPETLRKIFAPAFSTKAGHAGLGLHAALTTMRLHDGQITVDSTPGEGTTVAIYLPAAAKNALDQNTATNKEGEHRGRILIMDDEELVRSSVSAILTNLGYQVETARDGDEAIEVYLDFASRNERFDVSILDLSVDSGMNGPTAAAELKTFDPDATIVICSGHPNDPVMVDFREYGFLGAIQKPFDPTELDSLLSSLIRD